MSLRGIVARFKTGTYTVTRRAAGTHTLGRYTPGTASTFPVDAAVFPYTGRTLKVNADGQRAEDMREIFVETELICSPTTPDTISIDGDTYGTLTGKRYQDTAGSVYWHFVVSRRKAVP